MKPHVNIDEMFVRGDKLLFKSLFLKDNPTFSATVIFCLLSSTVFSDPPLLRGSSHYIVFFQTILTVHLLFIGTFTQVHVPSGIFSGFLYMVVVEIALFRGSLHINAIRKVVAVHLIQQQQPFFQIFLHSYLLRTCLRFVFIVGHFWKVTQVAYVLA